MTARTKFLTPMALFIVLMVVGCVTTPTDSLGPKIISLKSDFIKFSQERSPGPDSDLFSKNSAAFENVVYKEIRNNSTKIRERKHELVAFIKQDSSNISKTIDAFANLEKTAADHISKFKRTFPNADYDYEIYFLPSLLWFSGRAEFLTENQVAVAFGADNIAKNGENIPILFAHEMFHALHYKSLKLTRSNVERMESDPLALLWIEGFASYESALVNGLEPTAENIFGKLGIAYNKVSAQVTKSFLDDVAKNPKFDEVLLGRWFGAGDTKSGIPPMAGYGIGLRIVKELATSHDPKLLLITHPNVLKSEILAHLKNFTH